MSLPPKPDMTNMSDKGRFYTNKRYRRPKEGPRTFQAGSENSYSSNYDRVFNTWTCSECGLEVLRNREYCDKHEGTK